MLGERRATLNGLHQQSNASRHANSTTSCTTSPSRSRSLPLFLLFPLVISNWASAKTTVTDKTITSFSNVPSMRLLLEMPFVLVKRRRRRASRKGQSNNLTHIVSNAVGMSTIAVQKGKPRDGRSNEPSTQEGTKKDSQQDRARVSQGTYLQSSHGMVPIEIYDAKARLGRSYTTGHALSTIARRQILVRGAS